MKPLSLPPPDDGYEDEQDEKDLHEDEVRSHAEWAKRLKRKGGGCPVDDGEEEDDEIEVKHPASNLLFLMLFALGFLWWALLFFFKNVWVAYGVTAPLFLLGLALIYRGEKDRERQRRHDAHFADVDRDASEEEGG